LPTAFVVEVSSREKPPTCTNTGNTGAVIAQALLCPDPVGAVILIAGDRCYCQLSGLASVNYSLKHNEYAR
jgi:hypothetical protein